MARAHFIAIDLGASSGRVVDAAFDGETMSLRELHRFTHRAVLIPDGSEHGRYCWDVLHIWESILVGLRTASSDINTEDLKGIAIDSWGVDYTLISETGQLVAPSSAYRDPRTHEYFERLTKDIGREELYQRTGNLLMPINTLFQLAADASDHDRPLERADSLLMTPALYSYWLTGVVHAEHTLASTTQLYDALERHWISDFCDMIGAPAGILPSVAIPGDEIGGVSSIAAELTGLPVGTPVIATASHDSAAAIVGAPIDTPTCGYLSSGTWSLIGCELDTPHRKPDGLAAGFTNEAGVGGRTRFHANSTGLWILQECQRIWNERGEDYSFSQIERLAAESPRSSHTFDVNEPTLAVPCDMPAALVELCEHHGITPPRSIGETARLVYDSLAAEYARALDAASQMTGRTIDRLAVVGGGSKSTLLNHLTADATGVPVLAGSPEATSLGNALVQAMHADLVADLDQCRVCARASVPPRVFEPLTT
ncbi:MAG: rhamnulokinase family protein [Planctomycetota bacterium]